MIELDCQNCTDLEKNCLFCEGQKWFKSPAPLQSWIILENLRCLVFFPTVFFLLSKSFVSFLSVSFDRLFFYCKVKTGIFFQKDGCLHCASWEQRLPFFFGEHLLFVVALSQHQEAERAEDRGHQQEEKDVSPAAFWNHQNVTVGLVQILKKKASLHYDFTWYLSFSIPVQINVQIPKQHAAKM